MKTILISFLAFLVLGTTNAKPIRDVISVKEPALHAEAYINDIPFNTALIAAGSLKMKEALELDEEAYVNDIPFDTRCIACKALICKMISENIEENVNDIPFNTRKVYEECMMAQMIKDFECEKVARDIHFDTYKIANKQLMTNLLENFRDESEIKDIPYEIVCIISTSYNNEPAYLVLKKKTKKKSNSRKSGIYNYEYTIYQPNKAGISAPGPFQSILTKELMVTPGSSL